MRTVLGGGVPCVRTVSWNMCDEEITHTISADGTPFGFLVEMADYRKACREVIIYHADMSLGIIVSAAENHGGGSRLANTSFWL